MNNVADASTAIIAAMLLLQRRPVCVGIRMVRVQRDVSINCLKQTPGCHSAASVASLITAVAAAAVDDDDVNAMGHAAGFTGGGQ